MISHVADVVVCDGFVGNVVIKFFEGLTSYIFRSLRTDLQQGPWRRWRCWRSSRASTA